jgi:hypothetical protein
VLEEGRTAKTKKKDRRMKNMKKNHRKETGLDPIR